MEGKGNSGYRNSGYRNSGYCNFGNGNSGDSNLGNGNSGDCNSGDCNSGYRNSGDRNSGDWNFGDRNSGDWNLGNGNTGNLNTITPPLTIFNKVTKVRREDIVYPKYFYFNINIWITQEEMSEEEKLQFPTYKTTGGYLKRILYKEAWKLSFDKATKEDILKTLKLPNFNYKIFEEISGITKKMIQEKIL